MFSGRQILTRLKKNIYLAVFLISISAFSQNVQTNANLYSAQQLVENILINNSCVSNVTVTNVVGGNFGATDKSFGYFNANGSSFPFNEGLVLSTGKLSNVEGPNTTLSDDDATNWDGDSDLENVLNETNTTNATIIEFEFTSVANQISFNYIFASEEYQENNSNTCVYSDLFGFLIRPISESDYTNIALVPNTNTPVKVTTVHPNIPNGCSAINEEYFGSWNNASSPINFNGQTKVLTASAAVVPNQIYHVKLVIADEQNYRYDSAVFIEAGSFQSTVDLGQDRLFATNNPICFNNTLDLDAYTPGTNVTYKWFKNGVELIGESNTIYTIQNEGTYSVEVTTNGTCVSYGEIEIEYTADFNVNDVSLDLADNDTDGLSFFDLNLSEQFFLFNNPTTNLIGYYLDENEAINNTNPIQNTSVFFNTVANQVLYARIENEYGCFKVNKLTLNANYRSTSITELNVCDDNNDGFTTFNLNELRALIEPEVSSSAIITFYSSYNNAAYHQNQLPDSYQNTTIDSQEIWVKAQDIYRELIAPISLNVFNNPELLENEEQLYCLNIYPEKVTLNAGLINTLPSDSYTFEWKKNGVDLGLNQKEIEVSEGGNYVVRVTNQNNCFSERTIQVIESQSAIIDNVEINGIGVESDVKIILASGIIGNYEFALDNEIFQTDNTFLNVSPGSHTITVRDLNGCDTMNREISVFGFPKFFTPNNDGNNDTWNPFGINSLDNTITSIYIFNRFGKLLIKLDPYSSGWNGVFNGEIMPSSDYWFKAIFQDGQLFQGHFSLIR
ncbi:choice-of-anchor L domain-containing protein [Lutibacter sp. TH_r2]|uniref:choice-of-anchor L domain-containing protein n=1 Tax=Lutibacter sp. TH_r2 TaxID=3082083 RepID=UPI0029549E00|nr:choice-of-anchor L domain-containing protein [Lutibacter sp. TH_r2]MDV7186723.1 choice-of-anchor L domain-containing protein [Lutibacter sp. TH_r2]